MNERIRELAEQAREYATTRHPVSNIVLSVNSEKFEEKFAELIVNRMIDNVECHADLYESPDIKFICEKIVNSIKFDFGVEE